MDSFLQDFELSCQHLYQYSFQSFLLSSAMQPRVFLISVHSFTSTYLKSLSGPSCHWILYMCCETSLNNFFVMLVMHHFFTLFHHVLVWWSSFSIWLWRLWRFGCFWTFRFLLSDELFHFSNWLIICIGVGLWRIFRLLASKRTLKEIPHYSEFFQ